MKDPYRHFRVEARELALAILKGLLELEGEAPDRDEIVARLLRSAHTLKGAARVVGQAVIAELAHDLEGAIPAGDTGDLLRRVDAIGAEIARLDGRAAEAPAPPAWSPRLEARDLDLALEAIADARGDAGAVRARAGALLPASSRAARDLEGALASLDADLGRATERAHDLALVPVSSVFPQLERAARDTARALGKRVTFEAEGGEQHLDGRVLSLLRDALLHVVQNAVDHGIEDPGERVLLGKPPAGAIAIEVTRRGHRASIVCRDDGRGIDRAAVLGAAARRGLGGGDAELLVFEAGVSTRDEVSPISGRGVGLDAVREIAARLHGDVRADSDPGRGASFTITVPISLSSMPVLSVRAGAARASIPLDGVRSATRVLEGCVGALGTREIVLVEGRALPLLRLGAWLDPGAEGGPTRAAVVVEASGEVAAIGVERLAGVKHAVVLPVAEIAGPVPLVGASIDPDGAPVPVIDPAAAIAAARAARSATDGARRRRVLVIDDSLTSRLLEQSVLASAGFDADVAASAEEALEKARAAHYDVFVVDVEMPGMDGFQFVTETKADPALSGVPSIIVSSRASDADKRRGAESGARAWVEKGEIAEGRFLDLVTGLSR